MRRALALCLVLASSAALAEERKEAKEADLKKGASAAPDKSLAGDLTRKKEEGEKNAPALHYDQFRLGVELQVASKRHTLIEQLKKIISLSPDPKEAPKLHFQLAELLWEESKYFFFEANRKDDDYIVAMNKKDSAGMQKAKAEKAQLVAQSEANAKLAIDEYTTIVRNYRDFERMDEVLYFLGNSMLEKGEDRQGLVVFGGLVKRYPKSKYIPDAHLAFGEYYFNNSKGKREMLLKALDSYTKAAEFTDSQAYAFALYKQGWCYFNLGDYEKAMDKYKTVILYAQIAGANAIEKDGGKSGKGSLAKEARNDYVLAYSRVGDAAGAKAAFSSVAEKPEDRYAMTKSLANLFYQDGKDREAAVAYNLLIKETPLSPDAPGFQGRIVDCVLRAGNKKMTVEQVRRLVKVMQDVEKSGVIKEEKDKQALRDARELSERTLSNLAVTWHNEAKKTRDDETFELANQVYADYLTLFSDNAKAYDLRFFWAELLNDNLQRFDQAAEQYTQVALLDVERMKKGEKPGKFFTNALYNAILAYDEVVKKLDETEKGKPEPKENDLRKKLPMANERKALLEACERYVKYQPKGDKRVEIAFKAANLYYRHNYFDEAVLRFSEIALNYPDYKFENGDHAGEISANLVLDSYNILANWAKVNEWARKFYANDKLATGRFREELSKLIEESAFKLVNQLEAQKDYARAGEAYLGFVSEFPRSAIADRALYNASIDFHNAKLREKALEVRTRIVRDYPKSEFVPGCVYANAEVREAVGDFDQAADQYERYAAGYERSLDKKGKRDDSRHAPKRKPSRRKGAKEEPEAAKPQAEQKWEESKAQVALFNAGVFREGLGQLKQALGDRERYLALWPMEGKTQKDAEPVFLSIADLHDRMGAYNKELSQIEEYEKRSLKDPNKVLVSEGRLIRVYEQKLHRAKEAERIHARVLKYYDDLPARVKKALEPKAVEVVARAHLLANEADYRYFTSARLQWGRGAKMAVEFKATLQEKAKRLKVVQEKYTQTVAFKAGDPAICALYRIGEAYAHMAETVTNAPMPRGAPPELQDAIREELSGQAQAPRDRAGEAFAAAVTQSRELGIYNDCASKALTQLRDTFRPDTFPVMPEKTAELASVRDLTSIGGDVLAAVQEVPVLTPQQAKDAHERAQDIREQTEDLGSHKAPPPDEEPKGPAPASKPSTGTKAASGSDEPEDVLQ